MAQEEKKENIRKDEKKAPSKRKGKSTKRKANKQVDDALLSGETRHEEVSEHEIIAGDEDFYKLLSDSIKEEQGGNEQIRKRTKIRIPQNIPFSWTQRILIAGIVTTAFTMGYAIIKNRMRLFHGPAATNASGMDSALQNFDAVAQEFPERQEKTDIVPESLVKESISLDVAQNYYLQKNYNKAWQVYKSLYDALPESEELFRDYLHLRMALCSEYNRNLEQAYSLLTLVSESRSPAVRIISNYRLALIEIQRKRYLRARARAYKALALLKSVDFDDAWEMSFECDCNYLVCQCLTQYILSLGSTGEAFPEDLWDKSVTFRDPFEGLDEAQLKRFLESGTDQLYKGLLSPKIKELDGQNIFAHWSVTCFAAPVEEFLSKFATSAGLDIQWVFEVGSDSNSEAYIVRQRPVSLHIPSASSDQVMLIAAGCAELLAQKQDVPNGVKYLIYNPANYLSLNEHIKLLSQQAISLWQKFMLTFHADPRVGNVHFAMGLLQTLADQKNDAIAEYKLVANRFSQMSLAPYALLKSSTLKTEIRDYQGARDDFKLLIEQYPDTQIYRDAYLRLADATKQAGLYAEAAQLFGRAYNFELSEDSKTEAALGAGNCFYQAKAYEDAEIWFSRYISLSGDNKSEQLYAAHFLLGKTYLELEKYKQACDAFQFAITEQSSREQFVEAVKALVQSYIDQQDFVKALDALENTRSVSLSQKQFVEMLIQRSTIYRKLGLFDTAIDLLKNRSDFVTDKQLNAQISFELANCCIANENLEMGRNYLSEVIRDAEPGKLSQDAAKTMAHICLELGYTDQAASVCRQLLDSNVSGSLKIEVTEMLAQALNHEKKYEEAALVLSAQE